MAATKIEWADRVWNPITGCSSLSEGCRNCYAKRMAYRLKGRYGYPKDDPFKVTFHPDRLEEPLHWKKPSQIFVCSMGDLFHGDVKFDWQLQTWLAIEHNPRHTFMILTKRPEKMKKFFDFLFRDPVEKTGLRQPFNLYLGVSVENQQTADERIPILLQIPVAKRFVSVEPMLGPVKLSQDWVDYLEGWDTEAEHGRHDEHGNCVDCPVPVQVQTEKLDWVLCGGETSPGARPVHPDWIRSLVEQCQAAGVPFFFKSWGEWEKSGHDSTHLLNADGRFVKRSEAMLRISDTRQDDLVDRGHLGWIRMKKVGKKRSGRLLDGKIWDEMPVCSKDFP